MVNFEAYKLEVRRMHSELLKHERYLREFGANSRCALPCPHTEMRKLYAQGKQNYPEQFLELFSVRETEEYGRDLNY